MIRAVLIAGPFLMALPGLVSGRVKVNPLPSSRFQ